MIPELRKQMQRRTTAMIAAGTPNKAAGNKKMVNSRTTDEIFCRKAQARLYSSLL